MATGKQQPAVAPKGAGQKPVAPQAATPKAAPKPASQAPVKTEAVRPKRAASGAPAAPAQPKPNSRKAARAMERAREAGAMAKPVATGLGAEKDSKPKGNDSSED